ncbi:MAG: type IV toxin-antitoxin system AbiEi family antitoxin domain-containing protein [Verrucomicrobia bacterium]|nr:type IV toxin-antitoxin system AbiEi family antitoxin domain-containing protein [Verrucomicrobiota bacterium]
MKTQGDKLIRYVRKHRVIRPRDLDAIGVPRTVLQRLTDRGELIRQARGIYTLPEHEPTRHIDLATVSARASKAVVCLISALEFHEITTQVPHAVWIMISKVGHPPKIDQPPIRVVRASGRSLMSGIETRQIEGVTVRITSPAKTVADCFKYRDHVGQDVAIEALRDCLRQHKATPSDLYEMARIDRVARIIRPYIEALT